MVFKTLNIKFPSVYRGYRQMMFILLMISNWNMSGQSYMLDTASQMQVLGTSTLHDWEMQVTRFSGSFVISEEEGIQVLKTLYFETNTTGLVAENPKMQRDAHEVLEAEEFPTILFKQDQPFPVGPSDSDAKPSVLLLHGIVSIKGVEQDYEMPVKITWSENAIRMEGTAMLDMTAFGVEPPRAMLGIIRTGKEVEVRFDLQWIPE